jgi:hypothetical protein
MKKGLLIFGIIGCLALLTLLNPASAINVITIQNLFMAGSTEPTQTAKLGNMTIVSYTDTAKSMTVKTINYKTSFNAEMNTTLYKTDSKTAKDEQFSDIWLDKKSASNKFGATDTSLKEGELANYK